MATFSWLCGWLLCAVLSSHGCGECTHFRTVVAQIEVRLEVTVMKISPEGVAAIYRRECKAPTFEPALTAYDDGYGNLTIGCGHTGLDVVPGMVITRDQADAIFLKDVLPCEAAVNTSINVPLTQNQFDALVSLAFNIGVPRFIASTVVKKINAKASSGTIEKWFKVWNESDGKVVNGLVSRRASEVAQFNGTPFVASATQQVDTPKSWWQRAHNQLKAAGGTLAGVGAYVGFDADKAQDAGAKLQELAGHSPWFTWFGLSLIVAGIVYKMLRK